MRAGGTKRVVWLLRLVGMAFLILSIHLPVHLNRSRIRRSGMVIVEFKPGFPSIQESLSFLMMGLSILSAVAASLLVFPEKATQQSFRTLLLNALTMITFISGAAYALYLSLKRPLAGMAPSLREVYIAFGVSLLGIGLLLLSLAERIRSAEISTHESRNLRIGWG